MGGQISSKDTSKLRGGASSIFDVAKSGILLIIGNYTEPKMRDAMARCGNSFQKEAASQKAFPRAKIQYDIERNIAPYTAPHLHEAYRQSNAAHAGSSESP